MALPYGVPLLSLVAASLLAAMAPVGPTTEVLADEAGPYATRTRGPDGEWQLPRGDAVLLDEAWWTPLRPLADVAVEPPKPDPATLELVREQVAPAATRRIPDRLITVGMGDVTGDGQTDLVVSFRRPFRRTAINITRPRRAWVDSHDHSAHLGLYRPDDLDSIWIAGTLVAPVVELAACDGALAVAVFGQVIKVRYLVVGHGEGFHVREDYGSNGLDAPAFLTRWCRPG